MSPASCFLLYRYQPSSVLAGIAIGIYTLLTLLHLVRMLSTRTKDNVYFVLAGMAELTGYCARLYSAATSCSANSVVAYGVQSVLLILGPTLLMFTVGLIQPQFVAVLHGEQCVWVPLHLQRRLYLGLNATLLFLQMSGAIITVISHDIGLLKIGGKVLIAAYIIQIVFWAFLLAENTYFRFRLQRLRQTHELRHWKWWIQLFGLAITIIAFGRNLVRLTAIGGVTFLLVNEWPSYAFDGFQMVVVMLAWGLFYLPGVLKKQHDLVGRGDVPYEMDHRSEGRPGDNASTESRQPLC
ncbi:hypothetical protein NA57DRAFT_79440 [Rhizodiscina lignyota]|uniref:RTA1-domain-containing protein n=1 Tax=Rhizodiscina lignyota TaxID=1504668 RepID=A0A9P4IAK0_9PEZI|nr:hypothetical protein NA57DRAFT_79440 [Rhizodiscina lignyota]